MTQQSSNLIPSTSSSTMAGHGDLQEMLRMLTARKASMMAAMGYIKALQAKNLKRRESGAADAGDHDSL